MRVFLTGATGFIASSRVPELITAGHHAVGLSYPNAEALTPAGAEVFRGGVNDLARQRTAAWILFIPPPSTFSWSDPNG